MFRFPHSHGKLYMQFCDSCVWFGDLVFVSMLRSIVHDVKAVLMPNLLPTLLNDSNMPGAYGIIAVSEGLSCAVCLLVFVCFFVSMFYGHPLAVSVEDILCYSLSRSSSFEQITVGRF